MSLASKFAVAVLGLLLTLTLVASVAVGTAHLTVLDPDFVTTTMAEEDGYEFVSEQVASAAASAGATASTDGTGTAATTDGTATTGTATSDPAGDEVGLDRRTLVRDAIDEEFVANQTAANVDRLYAYLHGSRDEANLSVDLRPVKEEASTAVASEIRNATLPELLRTAGVSLPGPVNATLLERMTADESGYRAARADFRAAVRDRVLDRLVDEAFASADEDELLALVIDGYDPNEYAESEKRAMVEEREAEIRAALRDRIERERGDEIDSQVDARLDELRQRTTDATGDTELQRAAIDVQAAVVTGLTTDRSYDAFRSDLDDARERLAAAAGERTRTMVAEQLPDRVDLTENLGEPARRGLETARTGVRWLDRLALLLPVASGLLLGLCYLATGSATAVARTLGVGALWVGLPTYLSLGYVRSAIVERLSGAGAGASAGGAQAATTDLTVGFVDRFLGTLGGVTLTLSLVGGVLLVGSVVAGRGYLAAARDRLR